MGLEDIIRTAEAVGDRDERRRERFREELERYEAESETEAGAESSADAPFDETREALADEREALAELDRLLADEEDNIGELVEYTDFLTVEQAVEHRDETVRKLEKHNKRLRTFHDEMTQALTAVETNLDALETDGETAVTADPQPHFERAGEALEAHNDAVAGLGKNMTILNAYLV